MKSITITLGDRQFEIKEFTIGQVEQVHEILDLARESNHRRAATNRELIAAALSQDHPDATAESLKAIRVPNIQELAKAADQILEFGGWVVPDKAAAASAGGESKPGEAPAG